MKTKETRYCVRCGKPAKFWGGHLLIEKGNTKKSIIAGWCSKKCSHVPGFTGYYQDWMEML